MTVEQTVARHLLRRELIRGAVAWGIGSGALVVATIAGYASTYKSAHDRAVLAQTLGSESGLIAIVGRPRALDTIAGFSEWRSMGALLFIAAIWGLAAATRVIRGDEENGRSELLVAGPLDLPGLTRAALMALAAACAVLLAFVAAPVLVFGAGAHGFGVGRSLFYALVVATAAGIFAGVGALASQVAPTRRQAAALAASVFGAAYLLRVVADSSESLSWLRWVTPLGWLEEAHPLSAPRPWLLGPLLAAAVIPSVAAIAIAGRRDFGAGLLPDRGRREPNLRLLSSPAAFAWRQMRGGALAWALGLGALGLLFGLVARGAAESAAKSTGLQETGARLGADLATVEGYVGTAFIFLVMAVCLYAAALGAHSRDEEASGRLDQLLVEPVSRVRWLGGRLLVSGVCIAVVSMVAALATWVGTVVSGSSADLGRMLEAGVNGISIALLFLGLGTLLLGVAPRLTAAVTYGLVAVSFLLQLVGGSVNAPAWVLDLSPFHHIALVPAAPLRLGTTLALLGAAVVAALLGAAAFARRDLAPD